MNHSTLKRATPTKLLQAHYKEGATVGKAKVLNLDAEQLLFSSKPPDDKFLKDLDANDVRVHVYRPLEIRFPDGRTVRSRFAESATIRSTKETIAERLQIPVDSIWMIRTTRSSFRISIFRTL
jgi:hypothetical protein